MTEGIARPAATTRWLHRLATRNTALALGVFVLLLALAYAPITLADSDFVINGIPGSSAAEALVFAWLGVLVARRRPAHPVGWILIGVGLLLALSSDGSAYAVLDFVNHHGQLPLGSVAELLNLGWIPGLLLIPVGVLYFPDGLLPSPRWRVGVRAYSVVGAAIVVTFYAVAIRDLAAPNVSILPYSGDIAAFDNPTGALGLLYVAWAALVAVASVVALIGLGINFRRSTGERRQQIKWFLLGTGVLLIFSLPTVVLPTSILASSQVGSSLFDLALLAPPVTIAIGILKYRLYDIDVIISRTLVYGSLAIFITAVYVGIAVGIGTVVGSGGKPNLGLSILATAIVAVGFQPVRERMQKIANRLVYGKRATPYEVLSEFSGRVAESYASDEVLPRMARVLGEGTGAVLAEVWLANDDVLRRAAAFPLHSSVTAAVQLDSVAPTIPDADRTVEVRHQGELLGALTVTKRRGESLTPIEIKLMDDLAHQAGLVLKNVGLTADLQARLEDLRASRQRLVAAQDNERRRLERNLHDGAQQYLVAIKVKLGLVGILAMKDPEKARATVVALKLDADEALENLRDLARGIYPPLLADKGLAVALESHARKATVPVQVHADGIGRYPQETEAALYFCTLEALQNVQKYARASGATVQLREDGEQLTIEVVDDGGGFDMTAIKRGAGLTNMEDRLDALGGALQIHSKPGYGTTLRATVPILHAVSAEATKQV
jgi:signal transduction histidine kinase